MDSSTSSVSFSNCFSTSSTAGAVFRGQGAPHIVQAAATFAQRLFRLFHFLARLNDEIVRLDGVLQDFLHRGVTLHGFAVSELLVRNGNQLVGDFSVKPALLVSGSACSASALSWSTVFCSPPAASQVRAE